MLVDVTNDASLLLLSRAHLDASSLTAPWGYLGEAVKALLALLGVCALALFVLRLAARYGLGRQGEGHYLKLRERLPLGPKQAVYLVEAGRRLLLIGIGANGAPSLLAQLPARELESGQGNGPLDDAERPPSLLRQAKTDRSGLGEPTHRP
ncbi:MAG: flagellar biosynthetic protein FliO [Proteobacteria bacterium]|nr:flagellar biosynthetic protein FliO [Pseudomonadota bacterium]